MFYLHRIRRSLVGAPVLLVWDAVLSGSVPVSMCVCPIWFLVSVVTNAIQRPGPRRSSAPTRRLMRGIGGDEAAIGAVSPAGRRGTVEEIASAARLLASEDAAYITGHILVIDGGWIAR